MSIDWNRDWTLSTLSIGRETSTGENSTRCFASRVSPETKANCSRRYSVDRSRTDRVFSRLSAEWSVLDELIEIDFDWEPILLNRWDKTWDSAMKSHSSDYDRDLMNADDSRWSRRRIGWIRYSIWSEINVRACETCWRCLVPIAVDWDRSILMCEDWTSDREWRQVYDRCDRDRTRWSILPDNWRVHERLRMKSTVDDCRTDSNVSLVALEKHWQESEESDYRSTPVRRRMCWWCEWNSESRLIAFEHNEYN